MCRKLIYLISFVLVLGSVSNAEDIQWTDLGADHLWSNPENWDLGRVPTLADDVRIDVPAAAAPNGPVIQDGIDAKANGIFTEAPGEPTLTITGGTLEVADWIWWGDGADSFGIWTMSGGTVSVVNEFELGWGGGAGTLIMTGGTINAGEAVIPTGSGAFGELILHGGTYNVTKAGGLKVNATGLIDITEGTLVLAGNETAKINDLIAAGLITAYGSNGKFELDYNTRSGKTTVTAIPGPEPVNPGTNGLVAHYAFENDANDSSVNELHGTLVGDAKFAEGPAGYGTALELDGDGDYVDCGAPPQFDITEQITFTYWIKAVALDKSWNTVLSRGDTSWRSSRAGTNNFMEAAVGGTSGNYLYGVTPVDDDKWHHVGAVYDGVTFYLYVDGKLDASEESTGNIAVSSYPLLIGENAEATGRFWTGLIDEVMIYNRALSEGEVMYLAGKRVTPVDPGTEGLLAAYKFETDATDSSGNGYDGTLLGDAHIQDGMLVLDGADDAVAIPRIGGANATFSQLTYSMMVYPTVDQIPLQFSGGLNTDGWSSGAVHIKLNYGNINVGINGLAGGDLVGTTVVLPDMWSHLALTVSETEVALYLNGVLEDSRVLAAPLTNLIVGGGVLGAWNNGGDIQREMAGMMDDVLIYERALSVGEILYLAGERAVDPSLVIYYSFDEVSDIVADQSGKGHDGLVVGEVTAEANGKYNGAANFATGSYLDLDGPSFAAEDIPTSGMTLAAWIKCTNTGDHHAIFNARASDETWIVHPEARSNGEFRWLLRSYGGTTMFDIRAGAVTWDEWLHFAGTYDEASAKAALYINGELVSEVDVASPADIAGDWGLGARVGYNIDNARPFTGLMDEFRMFTRALSQDEILNIMQGM